ncbi:glycine reductase [Bacillus benzoevorans]|nr:glycine reductase [Bacillus benzoevorans]
MSKKVLYYLNQFFSQIGGEDQAGIAPQFKEEPVGPATVFAAGIKEHGKYAGTMICGDNFFNEHNEEALQFLEMMYHDLHPDLVIAGPAFNAGRYGMACAGVAEFFNKKGVPVISGMYEENPGLETTRRNAYVFPTSDSAAGMRKALPAMIGLAKKVLTEQKVDPNEDGYFTQGKRLTEMTEDIGAKRAVDMLLKRLKNEEFETELPMPEFDKVDPAPAIANLSKATIALVTTGGIVPKGNPDHLQSASAQKWVKYDVSKLDRLGEDYYTVHGGYDPVYANEFPDRVAPLDQLRQFEKTGYIGKVHEFFYSTTGTGTAVGNSEKFGREIGKELKAAGVDAVILTST